MPRYRAQALVEFALVFPILVVAFLGMGEAGFLFASQHGYQSTADVLASWAAYHVSEVPGPSWDAVAGSETARTGCDGSPVVSWPDGGQASGDRVAVELACHYSPKITSNVWPGGLDVSVQAEAVVAP